MTVATLNSPIRPAKNVLNSIEIDQVSSIYSTPKSPVRFSRSTHLEHAETLNNNATIPPNNTD
eukprot:CAMPEP_0201275914 /NCGR_PEP_ID=MMETSP0853-20130426/54357_1 /ASSEMBLY_ACC=CAM_ASM_000640 /TAXON_ID=183588 /ORGANISM="Pseudo-nitzschia fraudulenta, Strain WWA7" /LENGTH=62 /DNA_ID=CAMNT_0047583677 /DNA_START=66 /DNA_END=251 /DNA_ORIENTATION=+